MRLLLLSNTTGYQANAFREAAERVGVPLTLATDRCHVLDDPWGDAALPIKFHDPAHSAQLILDEARRTPFSAVVAIGDAPTLTAALAAEMLGLKFHSPAAVEACKNKWLARERFKAAGLLVPRYRRVSAAENPSRIAFEVPFPCVLKPLGLSASRGVIRADNTNEFVAAFRRIDELLKSIQSNSMMSAEKFIQIEGYISGQEFALEGLVTGGTLKPLALFDKPDPLEGPFFEETIYVTPSRLPVALQSVIISTTQRAVTALGLTDGPIHAEMRLNDAGVWMLEIAARPIGGLCAKSLRFCDDGSLSLEELIVRHALGDNISCIEREPQTSGVMMVPIPAAGVYEGVEGVDEAESVAGVIFVEITAKLQQKLVPLPEGASYLGFIFARGESPESVEAALREAHGRLRFRVSADIPVLRRA